MGKTASLAALASSMAGHRTKRGQGFEALATVNSDGTVTIDGSDTTTPATFAVEAAAGDRVRVQMRGHVVFAMGNITTGNVS